MKAMLITGANRGIGLEFVKQYAEAGWQVIATCRHPAKAEELKKLATKHPHISIYSLDVSNPESITQLKQSITNQPIDHLINNAGIYGPSNQTLDKVTANDMLDVYKVNTLGPLLLTQALLKNVADSEEKLIIAITSRVGSIADNSAGKNYGYRTSKAALNMAMKNIAIETEAQGIRVLILHPGWVKTSMGGKNALITTAESVSGLRNIINTYQSKELAPFVAFDGRELSW